MQPLRSERGHNGTSTFLEIKTHIKKIPHVRIRVERGEGPGVRTPPGKPKLIKVGSQSSLGPPLENFSGSAHAFSGEY